MGKCKKVIDRYDGALAAAQIAAGMNAAMRNSIRLYEDAQLLFEARKFPTACSLAILSIEESGKVSVVRGLSTVPARYLKKAWKDYRDHQKKNVAWLIGELAKKGARKLDDLSVLFDPNSDHPAILDTVKQLGFYTDCFGSAHWSEPHEAVDEELTKRIMFIAKVLLPRRETSEREIQLWMQHVSAHWGTREMARGALEFEKAMIAEGLSNRSVEEVEKFYDPATFRGVRSADEE